MTRKRIAIVGIAFRFPGPAGAGFWKALCEGQDLVGTVDASRWAREAYFHPRESEPGRLQPGRMFLVDTEAGRIVDDEELKQQIATEHPYGQWVTDNVVRLVRCE